MADGFPAVTTKKLVWKSMVSELLWFITGSNKITDLKDIYRYNKLWDANYEDFVARRAAVDDGDMGRVYGVQWRRWLGADGNEVDHLAEALEETGVRGACSPEARGCKAHVGALNCHANTCCRFSIFARLLPLQYFYQV